MAWTGPSGAPKDFELKADCIEVKARRGASQPTVKISNEHQLSDVPDRRLWLAILAVDKVQPPHGRTLSDCAAEITDLLERTEPSAILAWDMHLADAGYDVLDDYAPWRWIVSGPEFHAVTEGFPEDRRAGTPGPVERYLRPSPVRLRPIPQKLGNGASAAFCRGRRWASLRNTTRT